MNHAFKEGEVVCDRIRPAQKLIVKRFVANIYYCQIEENAHRKELVFLERELMSTHQSRR